jgi:hypothetical protein
MTQPSLKALAQQVLSRSKAGHHVGQQRDSGPEQVSQAANQVGRLNPPENRHLEAVSRCPNPIPVGQWDTSPEERDSAWDSRGTAAGTSTRNPSSYDAETGLPMEWIEGYRKVVIMRRPRAIPLATWTWLTASAGELLTRWGAQLAGHGWTMLEIFGVHYEAPLPRIDCAGLLAMLSAHHKIEAVSAKSVSLRTESGGVLRYYRPLAANPGIVPVWELTTGTPPDSAVEGDVT